MGSKRPYTAVESSAPQRKSHAAESSDRFGPAKKKRKSHESKEDSIPWVKKRGRDITRQLQRHGDSLPADVQTNLERELAAHNKRIEDHTEKRKRSQLISKYHMVRFFERKKAQRLQKKLNKRLEKATDPKEVEEIRADLHIADVDCHYAIYFPYLEPYISLYPVDKSEEDAGQSSAARALHSERPPLWKAIEEAMGAGQHALEVIRDRRPGADLDGPSSRPRAPENASAGKSKTQKTKKERPTKGPGPASHKHALDRGRKDKPSKRDMAVEESEKSEDSDGNAGGFFEE